MLSFMFGLIAVLMGGWGMMMWSDSLMGFLKGMLPLSLCLAGFIAMIMGIASLNSKPPQGNKKG